MLTAFTLKNFKSYRNATLPLAPLTVLIGANASGKSNAIEGLQMLSWLAQGQKFSSIRYSVQESERFVRGRLQDLGCRGENEFAFRCDTDEPGWSKLDIAIARRFDELHIVQECISGASETYPLYPEPRGGVMLRLIETFGGDERPGDAALLSDGTLPVLTTGVIDRFVKHHPGRDERKRRALQWLERMRSVSEPDT